MRFQPYTAVVDGLEDLPRVGRVGRLDPGDPHPREQPVDEGLQRVAGQRIRELGAQLVEALLQLLQRGRRGGRQDVPPVLDERLEHLVAFLGMQGEGTSTRAEDQAVQVGRVRAQVAPLLDEPGQDEQQQMQGRDPLLAVDQVPGHGLVALDLVEDDRAEKVRRVVGDLVVAVSALPRGEEPSFQVGQEGTDLLGRPDVLALVLGDAEPGTSEQSLDGVRLDIDRLRHRHACSQATR
jgi:hypothetical protein